jgi:ubiquinol-cytochrome c reductase iron-sulfur subunit
MAAADIFVTFAPFVDWGKFLPNTQTNVAKRAKAELPDGTQANIMTFPVNHSEVVIFPKTDDAVLNKEAFRMWQFIRLQKSLTVTRTMHLVVTHLDAST